jgi:hypothetical protein
MLIKFSGIQIFTEIEISIFEKVVLFGERNQYFHAGAIAARLFFLKMRGFFF